jgi:predicted ester cyclase
MSQEEANKVVVRRLIDEAFNNRNLAILPELLHEDLVNHQNLLPVENKKGPGVFEELYVEMFRTYPDIRIENHMMIADGDIVVIYDTLTGTNTGPMPDGLPASGNSVKFEAINILRLKDNKVIDRWGLTDELRMMKQLGIIE